MSELDVGKINFSFDTGVQNFDLASVKELSQVESKIAFKNIQEVEDGYNSLVEVYDEIIDQEVGNQVHHKEYNELKTKYGLTNDDLNIDIEADDAPIKIAEIRRRSVRLSKDPVLLRNARENEASRKFDAQATELFQQNPYLAGIARKDKLEQFNHKTNRKYGEEFNLDIKNYQPLNVDKMVGDFIRQNYKFDEYVDIYNHSDGTFRIIEKGSRVDGGDGVAVGPELYSRIVKESVDALSSLNAQFKNNWLAHVSNNNEDGGFYGGRGEERIIEDLGNKYVSKDIASLTAKEITATKGVTAGARKDAGKFDLLESRYPNIKFPKNFVFDIDKISKGRLVEKDGKKYWEYGGDINKLIDPIQIEVFDKSRDVNAALFDNTQTPVAAVVPIPIDSTTAAQEPSVRSTILDDVGGVEFNLGEVPEVPVPEVDKFTVGSYSNNLGEEVVITYDEAAGGYFYENKNNVGVFPLTEEIKKGLKKQDFNEIELFPVDLTNNSFRLELVNESESEEVGSLLDIISFGESGTDGYNAKYGGPDEDLTTRTVGEVLEIQKEGWGDKKSTAIGKYEIIRKTLKGLVDRGVVSKDELYNEANQDKLFVSLLFDDAKLVKYLEGDITKEEALLKISKMWAAVPVPYDIERTIKGEKVTIKKGQSYYEGDGLNKANIDLDGILLSLDELKKNYDKKKK